MSQVPFNLSAPAAGMPHWLNAFGSPVRASAAEARRARLRFALFTALVWTAVGTFQAVPEFLLRGFIWQYFLGKLIEAWAWALLTPAIVIIDRRLTAAQQNAIRISAIHLALSVPFALIHTYLCGFLEYPITKIWWNPIQNREFVMYYFLGGWVTYCAIVGALQAFNYYNRYLKSQVELERVEKRLIETRLDALRLQLEPHFLFNSLNAISSEVAQNPEVAREMIENLGSLLRRSLECQDSNEISLAEELALLDRYLAIQKLRFGTRISFQIDVEPTALTIMVPSLMLQPIVENAIRHGIEGRLIGGAVAITARVVQDELRITVLDDGAGLPPRWRMETCAGLGIRVTRERLDALYSDTNEYKFTVSRRRSGGTKVAIHLPQQRTAVKSRGSAS